MGKCVFVKDTVVAHLGMEEYYLNTAMKVINDLYLHLVYKMFHLDKIIVME